MVSERHLPVQLKYTTSLNYIRHKLKTSSCIKFRLYQYSNFLTRITTRILTQKYLIYISINSMDIIPVGLSCSLVSKVWLCSTDGRDAFKLTSTFISSLISTDAGSGMGDISVHYLFVPIMLGFICEVAESF